MKDIVFYLIIFSIYFIINKIAINSANNTLRKFLLFLGFAFVCCFSGFRYLVGTDYDSYLKIFLDIKRLNMSELFNYDWELGAKLVFKLCSYVFSEPRLIFLVISVLNFYPLYRVGRINGYKYFDYSMLIYCLVFLPFSFNGMRQSIAMSFLLWSFVELINNKNVKSIFLLIISILFHKTAIIFAPYLFLYLFDKNKKHFSRNVIILTLGVSIFILFFLRDFFINNDVIKYSSYVSNINASSLSFNNIIIYLPLFLLVLLFYDKNNCEKVLYNIMFVAGVIFEIVGTSARYLSRISLYFSIFQILLLPKIINELKSKNNKAIVKFLVIIYYIIYFYYMFYYQGKHEIFPYQSWLF